MHGDLDIVTAPQLTDALDLLPPGPVTIDAAELRFIDSTGIGALAYQWRKGRPITVTGAEGTVRRAFEICGFTDWLT